MQGREPAPARGAGLRLGLVPDGERRWGPGESARQWVGLGAVVRPVVKL